MSLKQTSKFFLILTISALALSACDFSSGSPTPTQPALEAVYTSAAETVVAQLNATSSAQPSATLTPSPTGTGTATATLAAAPATQTKAPVLPSGSGSGAVGCYNASYVADVTIMDGTNIAPNTTFTKTWKLKNTGTCEWTAGFKINFVSGDAMSGAATNINQTVAVGASADISVSLIAPATPKSYTGVWRMSTDGGQAFGETITVVINSAGTPGTPGTGTVGPTATYGASGCYNSTFLTDVTIQDGTQVKAGEQFTKTWRIKNTGTCAWTDQFKFTFLGGELMGSDTTKIRSNVAVGGTKDMSLTFTAPSSPGTYIGYWRMATDGGTLFGTSFSVKIVVPGATYTPTLTSTPVTPTNTTVPPTATGTPTVTPTTSGGYPSP